MINLYFFKPCIAGYCLQNPYALLLYPFLVLMTVYIMKKDFISFKNQRERESYHKAKRGLRIFLIISRSVIFLLLLIAIASPFSINEIVIPGDTTLTMLVDNSTSFELFDAGIVHKLEKNLEGKLPVNIRYIAHGELSALGEGLLNNIRGNDNVLMVSDGNNNFGRDLGDMILFASTLNTTINSLDLSPVKADAAVSIRGPSETVEDISNTYEVVVNTVGNVACPFEVTVDGSTVPIINDFYFTKRFSVGYHQLTAKLDCKDHFEQNNIYYKTVRVFPRPKILFYSDGESPLLAELKKIYDVVYVSSLPESLKEYSAVIINNVNAEKLNSRVDTLTTYIAEGNGVVVLGGDDSYDKGSYKNSIFETLLPVKVGTGAKGEESDVNVAVVIDISGSAGLVFNPQSANSKMDVEKALAINILSDIRMADNVAIIVFNHLAYLLSPLSTLGEKDDLVDQIVRLRDGGGTVIGAGLRKAITVLQSAKGSKNIILISDGLTTQRESALTNAELAAEEGIKIYTVGVGPSTHIPTMESLASIGNGVFFMPNESQYLKIIFGDKEEVDDKLRLNIIEGNHFITQGLGLNAIIAGFNQVVPKPSSRVLVATSENIPVVTIWRFGLGRVAAITTDDGSRWGSSLLSESNSKVITRSINWAIGDLNRNKQFEINVKDTTIEKLTPVQVLSYETPEINGLEFSKVGVNLYQASFMPEETGFEEFDEAVIAVNHKEEYAELGINPVLHDLVTATGGSIFNPDDTAKIVEAVKKASRRTKTDIVYYRLPFILATLMLFLIEVAARRIIRNRNIYK